MSSVTYNLRYISFLSSSVNHSLLQLLFHLCTHLEVEFPIMNVPRNLLLLFLSLAAVNSRPNFLDDWDNQIWSSDSIDSAELGLSDMGLSEPQDITNFYVTDDVFPSISGDTALADSGFDGVITNTFQGSTEDGLSGPISSFNDGDALFLFPTNGDTGELAMDDICPDGYWNRCCNGGYCFWGMFV